MVNIKTALSCNA